MDRACPELDTFVPDNPNKPYDIKGIIHSIADDGIFSELARLCNEHGHRLCTPGR